MTANKTKRTPAALAMRLYCSAVAVSLIGGWLYDGFYPVMCLEEIRGVTVRRQLGINPSDPDDNACWPGERAMRVWNG